MLTTTALNKVVYKVLPANQRYLYLVENSNLLRNPDDGIDLRTQVGTEQELFVDILEDIPHRFVKVRMYMPNGDVIVGFVFKENIELHNAHLLLDGRFNLIQ